VSLRFVLGRSGSGKTHYCLHDIRDRLTGQPDGPPLLMLVPEQATFQAEYALIRTPGLTGTIRAQALSFRRLAFRVMQETGGTALVPIGENGKQMLLYKILRRLSPELQLFQSGAEQMGFIERLGELLTEWKRYGVSPEALDEYGRAAASEEGRSLLERKLHDLRLIYAELETGMAGLYIDSEDYLDWLARGVAEVPALKEAEVWIDGFFGFTPKEYAALAALLRHVRRVTVTLGLDRPYGPGERPHELDLFLSPAETYIKLRELAEASEIEIEEPLLLAGDPPARFRNSPMLAHLERHFRSRIPMLVPDPAMLEPENERCGVSIHAAANRRAEVEAAARDMLRRLQDGSGDLRWRDFAVIVRNAADYHDYIAAVFADHGIPFFLDQRSRVLHHPLVELIRSALETVTQGWRYDAVFRCIKTEMLLPDDGSQNREALDRLENYMLAAGIDGWRWLDLRSWRPLTPDSLEDAPAEAADADVAALGEVLATREAVVRPLQRLQEELKDAGSVSDMAGAMFRFLQDIRAADRLEEWSREAAARGETRRAREHRQLWDGVMDALDQLVEMMGSEKVAPELFAGMLDTGLEGLKLASVPPAIDQVLVGSLDRTRSGHVRVCYVLGVNDGVMPMRIQEDGLLTEPERERLIADGLAMAPGARRRLLEERFLIYNAFTAPSHHLWISYSLADEEGKSLHPSEMVRHVRSMFPGIAEHPAEGEPSSGMPEAAQLAFVRHPERSLSYLIAQLRAWKQGESISPLWWDAYNWYAASGDWRDRLAGLTASLTYANEGGTLSPDTARRLYGEHLRASVSRMERFVSCPFQHFASHGLRLRERRLFRLEAPDIGQLFHASLSRLAAGLGDRFGTALPDELRGYAAAAVEELAPRLQSQILLSSSRYQYVARKLKEIVSQAAVVLGEHARKAQFKPVGLEVDFGPNGRIPSLLLPLDGGRTMEIVGRIDRIDAAETPDGLLLRVLDYKSSDTRLKLEEVVYGLSLQMLTYLDVAVTNAPEWLGRPAEPAGVLYFHVHNPLLGASNRLDPDKAREQLMKRFKLKGLVLADERAVRLMDAGLDYGVRSELVPVAIKKDGDFHGNSSVVTREQFGVLRRAVRRTIRSIGKRILDGEVSITPYRMGGKMPCQFCSYKPVCQFDQLVEGNGFVRLRKPPKDRIWDMLAEGEAARLDEDDDRSADEAGIEGKGGGE